jgi:hypothetical protein
VLASSRSPSTLNNVGFALLHVTVLLCGAAPALRLAHRVRRQTLIKEIPVDQVSADATLDS